MAQLPPETRKILEQHGGTQEDVWNCHGTWVIYHKALERIATKAGVKFALPQVIRSEIDECVVLVSGTLKEREEWSFGEAAPKNNKNAYPYAMAEKRGKDRVILKLIGLSGFVYSEEEADDFKKPPKQDGHGQEMDARTVKGSTKTAAQAKRDGDANIVNEMQECSTLEVLHDWYKSNRARIEALPVTWQNHFWPAYDEHMESLKRQEAA